MLNKQTLVAQAKLYFDNLYLNEKIASVLYEEMFNDVLFLLNKFETLKSGAVFRLRPGAYLRDSLHDLTEVLERIRTLLLASRLHQRKLLDARLIIRNGKESMEKFINNYTDGNWKSLSRNDILELRILLKKDAWILKQKEVNMDELRKNWDEADIIKKMEDCIKQKGRIQAGQSID